MGLTWSPPHRIRDGHSEFPYAHWWQTRASSAERGNVLSQSKALNAVAKLVEREVEGIGRATEIVSNIPAATTLPLLLEPSAIRAQIAAEPKPLHVDLRPGDGIVAAIDDGAFFAHERLRRADQSSRVIWTWLQGAPARGESDLAFGREFDAEDIGALMRRYQRGAKIDEAALYREAGLINLASPEPQSAALRSSHGMGVMDLLAGGKEADRLHVMWVSLPPRVTHDTSGSFIAIFALFAFHALLKRITLILDNLEDPDVRIPVSINLSYGLSAGPKDGNGLLERYVEERLATWDHARAPLAFFAPVGNNRLTQTTAHLSAGTDQPLFWHLPPDDPTPSFLEIWGAPEDQKPRRPTMDLTVTPPGAEEAHKVGAAMEFESFSELATDGKATLQMRAYFSWTPVDLVHPGGPGRQSITLVTPPTRPDAPGQHFVSPGRWEITVSARGSAPKAFDLFVQRDDSLPGYRRHGRQSWLVDGQYQHRDIAGRTVAEDPADPGPVRRAGSLNALVSGPATTLVGSTRGRDGPPSAYSSSGFAVPAKEDEPRGRRAPDTAAPGERAGAWPFLAVAGAFSGSRVEVRGTSFAAPQAARDHVLTPDKQKSDTSNPPANGPANA